MESLVELVRVRSWDDYIGQTRLKTSLDIKVRAAVEEDRMFDHTLFVAPPGSGKTTLVELLAERLQDELLTLPMPMKVTDFMYELECFCGGIVFLDELHNAPPAFQEVLQRAINDGYISDRYGERVDTDHITFIGATTTDEQKKLLGPLVERFKYRPSWDPYSDAEMTQIVAGMAHRSGTDIPEAVCEHLGRCAGGNPRAVQDLVASARDLAAVGEDVTVAGVLSLAGLDSDGLNQRHIQYLEVLHAVGGTAGMTVLSNMLGMNTQSVQDVERLLLMRGFVRLTPHGRRLLQPGLAKVNRAAGGARDPIAARRQRRSA